MDMQGLCDWFNTPESEARIYTLIERNAAAFRVHMGAKPPHRFAGATLVTTGKLNSSDRFPMSNTRQDVFPWCILAMYVAEKLRKDPMDGLEAIIADPAESFTDGNSLLAGDYRLIDTILETFHLSIRTSHVPFGDWHGGYAVGSGDNLYLEQTNFGRDLAHQRLNLLRLCAAAILGRDLTDEADLIRNWRE